MKTEKNKFPNLNPALKTEIALLEKKTASLPKAIKTEEEFKFIGSLQKRAFSLIKSIEAWYDKKIDPLNKVVKDLRGEKKALLEKPNVWNDEAEDLLASYRLHLEEEAEKERLRLQKKLDAEAAAARKLDVKALKASGDKEAALALMEAPIIAPVAEVAVVGLQDKSFRDDVEVTLLDINAVPDEYVKKELRLADVKAAWKNGITEIPGLLLKKKKILVNG